MKLWTKCVEAIKGENRVEDALFENQSDILMHMYSGCG